MSSPTSRLNWLRKNALPVCPGCGEEHQIQLIDYIGCYPARWKCRECKTKFLYEPKETHHEAS